MKDLVDLETLMQAFEYNQHTGEFAKVKRYNWKNELIECTRNVIDCENAYGYYQVNFKRKVYLVHRLIVYMMTGEYPEKNIDIDHINGDRSDNRWCNLRIVDRACNLKNVGMRIDNTSGVKGVHLEKSSGKYFTFIYHNKRRIVLGRFATIEEAEAARINAMAKYNYHENHGSRDSWRKS